ncbi:MAG: glycosyltransferase [Candidatus Saccharimonadales bacterium]
MRIGLFTDSYLPAVTGITFVIQIMKKDLEAMGHEVFIFCAGESVRPVKKKDREDHVIRFPSIPDAFFEDYGLTLVFPPRELHKIKKLNLDIIQIMTPGQVGLMGVYASEKMKVPLVVQHSTDVAQYIQHYPGVVPGLLILALSFPATFRFKGKDVRELLKIYRPRRAMSKWGRDIVESLLAMIFSRADAVIALSTKSKKQLESWSNGYDYDVKMIPTGVDALPKPTTTQIKAFKQTYGIAEDDEVVLYVGRLAAEKNLDILIPTIKRVLKTRPKARLLFVGDFEYKETLELKARKSRVGDRITFTGRIPRQQLGVAYASGDIFAFPSLTDTQGLVLHEAAHASLPFVITDPGVTQVVIDGENGIVAKDTIASLTDAIITLLNDDKLRKTYGENSKKLASKYTEFAQSKKLEDVYTDVLSRRVPVKKRRTRSKKA